MVLAPRWPRTGRGRRHPGAALVVVANILVDGLYSVIDPHIRLT
jgi:hypothetical protein